MDLQMPLVMLEETLSSVTVSSFSVVPQNRLDPALMMNANCSTPQDKTAGYQALAGNAVVSRVTTT